MKLFIITLSATFLLSVESIIESSTKIATCVVLAIAVIFVIAINKAKSGK